MNNYITIAIDPSTNRILAVYASDTADLRENVKAHPEVYKKVMVEVVAEQIIAFFRQHQSGNKVFDDLYLLGNGSAVVKKPNIPLIKQNQIAMLYSICTVKCSEGLTSSVLGNEYRYPSTLIDQQNMQSITLVALAEARMSGTKWSALVWCATEDDSTWDMRPHTVEQIIELNADYCKHIEFTRTQLRDKVAQINAVSDDPLSENADKIKSIYW
jgi:hypothetical protein